MTQPSDVIEISGPTVSIFEPDWYIESRYSSGIVYSVQLLNGMIVTSPEGFPMTMAAKGPASPPKQPIAK